MRIYNTIRSLLSQRARGRLTQSLYILGMKPKVNRRVRSPFKTGVVVLSADFEMAWAFRFSKTRNTGAVETGLKERKNVPLLLEMFDRYDLPVTWATVGHLFLGECAREENGLAHAEMPRPDFFVNRNWSFTSGDWYDHDPCTGISKDPAWYASDLIDLILESQADHEIGCHSFSHADFSYEHCSEEMADAELSASVFAAKEKGIHLRSMVFPGGTSGNYKSLADNGFICYRMPMKHHIDMCYTDQYGLVAIPSSIGLGRDQYGWNTDFHIKIIRRFLKVAARRRLICHFWFHPSIDQWYLDKVMPAVLSLIAGYRDQQLVSVMTMGQLAEEFRKSG